jgi:hypothetical protein
MHTHDKTSIAGMDKKSFQEKIPLDIQEELQLSMLSATQKA